MIKVSMKFYNDRPVRAVWDDEKNAWAFSVLDVISGIRNEDVYQKIRNYWKYLKNKIKKSNSELVSATNQLKIEALLY